MESKGFRANAEAKEYKTIPLDGSIGLPWTRKGFETLLKRVCEETNLPVNDSSRCGLAQYVHSLGRDTNTTTIKAIVQRFHKDHANFITMRINEECVVRHNAQKPALVKEQAVEPDKDDAV